MDVIKIKDMVVGSNISTFALVKAASVNLTKTNKNYLDMTLTDGTDELNAKVWDYSGTTPAVSSVIAIDAKVGEWNNLKQLTISHIEAVEPSKISIDMFIKRSDMSYDTLWARLMFYVAGIKNADLNQFVYKLLERYKGEVLTKPAALKHHQNYVGGLAEHMCNVTHNALSMADDTANTDIIIAGALLHDIGKIRTYKYNGAAIEMTDEGKLVGHMALGIEMLGYLVNYGLDNMHYRLLQHIILSHHGKFEWGSPVLPMTKEAILIHEADKLDTTMHKFNKAMSDAPEDAVWTSFNREFGCELLKSYTLEDGYIESTLDVDPAMHGVPQKGC